MKIDINCDMGESFGRYRLGADTALLPLVTSANIACGFHAGDPQVMDASVRAAVKAGAALGAHPGYPDLQGFGRREMDMTPEEIETCVLYQVSALAGFARSAGVELVHVKPHGALYNHAARSRESAAAIARAVVRFSRQLILVGLAGSLLIEMGAEAGLRTASEGFPERAYNPDGSLMSRRLPGAVIDSPQEAAAQALRFATEGIRIIGPQGERSIAVDTLCIHGDSPNALNVAQAVRSALFEKGIQLAPLA
jgi:5-oxoprolinase (ATP-hydrolysing) subunit A